MANTNKGYVKIYRDIMESDIWISKEPFDKRSAWIDLIMMANHADKDLIIGNNVLVVHRGQTFTSMKKLATRWHWGRNRVYSYIKLLEATGMVYRSKTLNGTLLTLINYGKYQDHKNTSGATYEATPDTTYEATFDTTTDTQTRRIKNVVINDKRMNKKTAAPFEDF